MPSEPQETGLDLKPIAFPTDRLTIGDLRRDQPVLFSQEGLFRSYSSSSAGLLNVLTAMLSERILAEKAFAKAAGQADRWASEERREHLDALNEYYVRLGLSSGPRATRELVRQIEQAAVAQAPTGRPPR